MGRLFSKNLSNYVTIGTAAISPLFAGASQISVFVVAHFASLSSSMTTWNRLCHFLADGDAFSFLFANVDDTGADPVFSLAGRSQASDSLQTHVGSTVLIANTWFSAGGVVDFAGDEIRTFVNGSSDGSTSVTFGATTYQDDGTPTSADRIGGPPDLINFRAQWDGGIARVATWSVGLELEEFQALDKGVSPFEVRPDGLVNFWPMFGIHSPEPDFISGKSFSITGSIPRTNDPPVGLFTPRMAATNPLIEAATIGDVYSLIDNPGLVKTLINNPLVS